jgi:hypothetical protein
MKKKENADHISTLLGIGTTIEGTLALKTRFDWMAQSMERFFQKKAR